MNKKKFYQKFNKFDLTKKNFLIEKSYKDQN